MVQLANASGSVTVSYDWNSANKAGDIDGMNSAHALANVARVQSPASGQNVTSEGYTRNSNGTTVSGGSSNVYLNTSDTKKLKDAQTFVNENISFSFTLFATPAIMPKIVNLSSPSNNMSVGLVNNSWIAVPNPTNLLSGTKMWLDNAYKLKTVLLRDSLIFLPRNAIWIYLTLELNIDFLHAAAILSKIAIETGATRKRCICVLYDEVRRWQN